MQVANSWKNLLHEYFGTWSVRARVSQQTKSPKEETKGKENELKVLYEFVYFIFFC